MGLLLATAGASGQTFFGPTPYLCIADSPFAGIAQGYFYLESFEDHLFNVPGVTANRGIVTSTMFVGNHDSVDCDDGAVNGSGSLGDSFFSQTPDITFTFSAAVLGSLPTRAGLVWTDGGFNAVITFEAFGPTGASLGTVTGNHADSSNAGTTAEDRFYGVAFPAGISAIRIHHTTGGLEIDHLQYGGGNAGCTGDFNHDGDIGTDSDIEAFFACLGGNCCPLCASADFNGDGDIGTDSDIESFFRVLAGGPC
jgi:hypothetical protein